MDFVRSLAFLVAVVALAPAAAACPTGFYERCIFDGACFCLPEIGSAIEAPRGIRGPTPTPGPNPVASPSARPIGGPIMPIPELPSSHGPILVEMWREITVNPNAPWVGNRPAIFSYLLSGEIGGETYSGSDQRIVLARANMNALLTEIQILEKALPGRELHAANLFCIPSVRHADKQMHFDPPLASEYRQALAQVLANETILYYKLAGPGPFIVATRRPVNELLEDSRGSDILLIDLSDVDTKSVVVFLNEYKSRIRRQDIVGSKEFAPLRPAMVSLLLKANAAVPFISSVYAGARVPVAVPAPASRPGTPAQTFLK